METDSEAIADVSIPVKFSHGGRDLDMGLITISPSMPFETFQAAICRIVELAPRQIFISLVRRKKGGGKVPIDEASDFAEIARAKDAFVLVSHRRPRRQRRRRAKREHRQNNVGYREETKYSAPSPERMILRRNPAAGLGELELTAVIGGLSLGMWDYESRIPNLQRQPEMFFMSMAATADDPYIASTAADSYSLNMAAAYGAATWRGTPGSPPTAPTCKECEAAEADRRAPEFHPCVYDPVICGFRTTAGPIQRPTYTN